MPNNNEIIIITAARPGLWLKEKINVKRWLAEKFHKDYGKTMNQLRKIDDAIDTWVKDIENILKNIKKRQKQPGLISGTRAIDMADMLGDLNRRFKQIEVAKNILEEENEKYLDRFEDAQYKKRHKNYGGPVNPKYQLSEKELKELERLRLAATDVSELFAYGGFWDDLKERWVSRRREKAEDKKRRQAFESLIEKAESLTKSLKSHLKGLHEARATGNIGDYVDILSQISAEQTDFETDYVEVYQNYIQEPFEETALEKEYEEEPETLALPEKPVQLSEEDQEVVRESPELTEVLPTAYQPASGPSTLPGLGLPNLSPPVSSEEIPVYWDEPSGFVGPPSDYTMMGGHKVRLPSPEAGTFVYPEFEGGYQPPDPRSVEFQEKTKLVRRKGPGAGTGVVPADLKSEKWQLGPATKKEPIGRQKYRKTEYTPPSPKQNIPEWQGPETQPEGNIGGVEFEGISPADLDIPGSQSEISAGPGTARSGPAQVQVEALRDMNLIRKIKKESNLYKIAQMLLKHSAWYESKNANKSTKLLAIAETILAHAE